MPKDILQVDLSMTQSQALPTYHELNEALATNRSEFNASQVHGLICGLICIDTAEEVDTSWMKKILASADDATCIELLRTVYETSYHQLSDFSFEFAMLLPNDDMDINARTEELGLWCQGFLTGLEKSRDKIEQDATEAVAEAIADITEIAQVNFGDITDSEEDEAAYFELVEYVRLAVLMLFHEFRAATRPEENQEGYSSLH